MTLKVINHELSRNIDTLNIYVLSDLHIGEGGVDTNRMNALLRQVEQDPNARLIVNGDIVNNGIKTSVSDIYHEELSPSEQIRKVAELLTPVKDKILVIHDGNHEKRTSRLVGLNIMELVAVELYGREMADEIYSYNPYLLFVAFGKNYGRDSRKTVYSIYGKHGTGGGRTTGAKMNHLERMLDVVNADIFIHSHTHVPATFKLGSHNIDYKNRKATFKEHLFVNSNAFLKYGGYGEELGFRPTSTQFPKIVLDGERRQAQCLI